MTKQEFRYFLDTFQINLSDSSDVQPREADTGLGKERESKSSCGLQSTVVHREGGGDTEIMYFPLKNISNLT